MKELLIKLRQERFELFGKIKKLEKFRGTDEWNKLSVNHKQLLDIQLNAMRTYLESLIGRCLDIEENLERAAAPVEENKEETEDYTESEKQVKVMIIGLGE